MFSLLEKKGGTVADLLSRTKLFYRRATWLGSLMTSKFKAIAYLLRARKDRMALGEGVYGGFPFSFRGNDISALNEVFIDAEYNFLRPFIEERRSPIILDVGAHIGTFSIWLLSINHNANILSIEADPATYKVLSNNIGYSSNKNINWRAINRAAWNNGDSIRFCDEGDSMSHRVSTGGKVEVSGITLREALEAVAGSQQIDLMKIDIEGAEEAFLCATPDLLDKVDRLVIELHPGRCDTDRIRGLLQNMFSEIIEVPARISSKPLLYCRS